MKPRGAGGWSNVGRRGTGGLRSDPQVCIWSDHVNDGALNDKGTQGQDGVGDRK